MAREKDLDLVEVSPNSKPPVCKIMSWSKFKYELSKKRKSSSKGKSKDMKEMRFTPYISDGDIDHKLKRVEDFLTKKHPVKLTIIVRGRIQEQVVRSLLDKILKLLEGKYETDESPHHEGRNLAILIYPAKSISKSKNKK